MAFTITTRGAPDGRLIVGLFLRFPLLRLCGESYRIIISCNPLAVTTRKYGKRAPVSRHLNVTRSQQRTYVRTLTAKHIDRHHPSRRGHACPGASLTSLPTPTPRLCCLRPRISFRAPTSSLTPRETTSEPAVAPPAVRGSAPRKRRARAVAGPRRGWLDSACVPCGGMEAMAAGAARRHDNCQRDAVVRASYLLLLLFDAAANTHSS